MSCFLNYTWIPLTCTKLDHVQFIHDKLLPVDGYGVCKNKMPIVKGEKRHPWKMMFYHENKIKYWILVQCFQGNTEMNLKNESSTKRWIFLFGFKSKQKTAETAVHFHNTIINVWKNQPTKFSKGGWVCVFGHRSAYLAQIMKCWGSNFSQWIFLNLVFVYPPFFFNTPLRQRCMPGTRRNEQRTENGHIIF